MSPTTSALLPSQSGPEPPGATSRFTRAFLTIWAGQTVSQIGSMLSNMAGGMYVFLETGSPVLLGVMSAVAGLPVLGVAAGGSIIDRFPRRATMIVGDLVAAVGPVILLAIALSDRLAPWHLIVAGFASSAGNAVQTAADQAAVPALVDPEHLERAHSLKQLSGALGVVVGPLAAMPILVTWGIETVLVIDLATFAIGIGAVVLTPFADPPPTPDVADTGSWRDMWQWLRQVRPLMVMLALSAALNLTLAFFNLAILVASTEAGGPEAAGLVLGLGGGAMVLGSTAGAALARSDDRIGRLAISLAVVGVGFVIAGSRPSVWVQAIGVCLALSVVPTVSATYAAIFNSRTPTQMQGRVFSTRAGLGQGLHAVGSLASGFVIADLATPAMRSAPLADSLGRFVGTGSGSGASLVLIVTGAVTVAIAAWLRTNNERTTLRR